MAIYAMTGGATGIGAALKQQLKSAGHEVISVDIKEGDIIADLSSSEGRQAAVGPEQQQPRQGRGCSKSPGVAMREHPSSTTRVISSVCCRNSTA